MRVTPVIIFHEDCEFELIKDLNDVEFEVQSRIFRQNDRIECLSVHPNSHSESVEFGSVSFDNLTIIPIHRFQRSTYESCTIILMDGSRIYGVPRSCFRLTCISELY